MLTLANDAADAVNGIANFWEDEAEVLIPLAIILEDDA
jgi:hypothetical protein